MKAEIQICKLEVLSFETQNLELRKISLLNSKLEFTDSKFRLSKLETNFEFLNEIWELDILSF